MEINTLSSQQQYQFYFIPESSSILKDLFWKKFFKVCNWQLEDSSVEECRSCCMGMLKTLERDNKDQLLLANLNIKLLHDKFQYLSDQLSGKCGVQRVSSPPSPLSIKSSPLCYFATPSPINVTSMTGHHKLFSPILSLHPSQFSLAIQCLRSRQLPTSPSTL